MSENVRVISIVGRFLEHARVFAFTVGGETALLDRLGRHDGPQPRQPRRAGRAGRGPASPAGRSRRSSTLQLADTALAWELGADGDVARIRPAPGEAPLNSQEALMERASRQARADLSTGVVRRGVRYRGHVSTEQTDVTAEQTTSPPGPRPPSRASTRRRPTSTSSATRPSASPSRRPASRSTSRSWSAPARSPAAIEHDLGLPDAADGLSYADLAVLLSQSK